MLPASPPVAAAPVAAAPPAPRCPTCGAPAVFHAQVGKWGCDHCRAYIDAVPPGAPAPAVALAPAAGPTDAAKAARRAAGVKMMALGGVLCLIGIIITAATHEHARSSGGGTYIIAYGPIIVGAIRFFQGLFYTMS